MDNPFYTLSIQLAKLQESVDHLLASRSETDLDVATNSKDEVTLSRKELAAYLRCSLGTVDRYKRDGVIPYIQAGRTLLFQKTKVDRALASDAKKKGAKPHG